MHLTFAPRPPYIAKERLRDFFLAWLSSLKDPLPLCLKVDTNRDRLVTLEEFLKSTERKEFNNAKGWEVRSAKGRRDHSGATKIFPVREKKGV